MPDKAHSSSADALDITTLRRLAGLTQSELAARLNTTQAAISRIERGSDLLLSTINDYASGTGVETLALTGKIGATEFSIALPKQRRTLDLTPHSSYHRGNRPGQFTEELRKEFRTWASKRKIKRSDRKIVTDYFAQDTNEYVNQPPIHEYGDAALTISTEYGLDFPTVLLRLHGFLTNAELHVLTTYPHSEASRYELWLLSWVSTDKLNERWFEFLERKETELLDVHDHHRHSQLRALYIDELKSEHLFPISDNAQPDRQH